MNLVIETLEEELENAETEEYVNQLIIALDILNYYQKHRWEL